MIYRFLVLSDEVDDFKRVIKIDSEATFLDLHDIILESVGYTKDQMCSFFICDDDWSKKTEITLMFVFDYMTERAFFMELRAIITGQDLDKPICTKSVGQPPVQVMDIEEFDAKNANTEVDEDFYGDSEYDPDELDEGFGGINDNYIDNPYDDRY